jgi:hypothetical protein
MLPEPYRWIHAKQDSYLHYHFKCVAVVYRDGRVHLQGWGQDRDVPGRSHRLAVRMVERWVRARRGWP